MKFLDRLWRILISVRFAVVIIVLLALSLAVATVIESKYDTKTAQYFVYQSKVFYGILSMLGILITAVALSRWPWQKKHTPFLLAHSGIIILLVGSAVTQKFGIDGTLRVSEGEMSSGVELDEQILVLGRGDSFKTINFPWLPQVMEKHFKPIDVSQDLGLPGTVIDQYIADSEMKVDFKSTIDPTKKAGLAVQLKIKGPPMMMGAGQQTFWLWSGDPAWSSQKLGPLHLVVSDEQSQIQIVPSAGEALLQVTKKKNGKIEYLTISTRGEKKRGEISGEVKGAPFVLNPEWKMPIQFEFLSVLPQAINHTEYQATKTPAGRMNRQPSPALRVQMGAQTIWLGLGDRANSQTQDGQKITLSYDQKVVTLPFGIRLKKFEVLNDPGTQNAAAYRSFIQVVDQIPKNEADLNALPVHEVSMNEPFKKDHYTFYQASYIPDLPRPTTTILSVNYDPGRELKYLGSLLIVLGSIILYWSKAHQPKHPAKRKENVL